MARIAHSHKWWKILPKLWKWNMLYKIIKEKNAYKTMQGIIYQWREVAPKNSICSGTGSYLELHFEHEAFLRLDSRLWTYYMRRGGMWSGKCGVNPGLTHIRSQIVPLNPGPDPCQQHHQQKMQLSYISFYRLVGGKGGGESRALYTMCKKTSILVKDSFPI